MWRPPKVEREEELSIWFWPPCSYVHHLLLKYLSLWPLAELETSPWSSRVLLLSVLSSPLMTCLLILSQSLSPVSHQALPYRSAKIWTASRRSLLESDWPGRKESQCNMGQCSSISSWTSGTTGGTTSTLSFTTISSLWSSSSSNLICFMDRE